ncbi:MAG: glycoside hydrolase family 3 C-terminal domain-containing protein [Clostridia bacterium]|nr:glycoside hydrolase family 3 C-terminal domain-containing protein [Clostridia bacterium]
MEKYARFRYFPNVPLGEDGRKATASQEHINLSREAAGEGMVLLKNKRNALPLKKGQKIVLLGKATIEYIKGGGGSGDVHCPYVRNIYEAFKEKEKEGKVEIYMPLVDFYKDYVEKESVKIPTQEQINATWDIVNAMEFCTKRDEMTYDTFASMHVKEPRIKASVLSKASDYANTAILTLSRFSAEGVDRRAKKGDYYLSPEEEELIFIAGRLFSRLIVVINSGGIIDCEYMATNDKVKAILHSWQGGMEGAMAIADIICGDVTPSGKLADTITTGYDRYPCKDDFWESFQHINYTDDIYVGYRYFETLPRKNVYVRYPFGYGLSYTKFDISNYDIYEKDGKITAKATVKNVGNYSGKEVLQLYYSAPQGKLGKPAKELAAFAKTKLLAPDESEELTLTFNVNDMASFDDLGKIRKSAYVLEKGDYKFHIGTSVRDTGELEYVYTVEEDTVTEQLQSWCKPFRLKKRLLSNGKTEKLYVGKEQYYYGEVAPSGAKAPETLVKFDDVGEKCTLDEFVAQMTLDELMYIVGGQKPTGVCNTGSFGGIERLGVPYAPTADGPAGVRIEPNTGVSTTAWPCATLLACCWNPDLVYRIGVAAGKEIRENNLGIWLAPALNIHRDPLCGRNFEYYSEDPLVAGKNAAAMTRGVQSQKAAVSIKHFACNNKEANRYDIDARISERALREIYLKGFEIAVKEGDPWTVMSSYNRINGQHTSESYELLTEILRNEWGFKGMVVTDWGVKNDPVKEVQAGNDMKMHCGYPQDLMKAYKKGKLTRAELELCAKRILAMIMKLA